MGDDAALTGWRLWRLRHGGLHSWVLDHAWEPGPNHARCLTDPMAVSAPGASPREPCRHPPGEECACGLWALFDLARCLTKARCEPCRGGSPVVGLVCGWGVTAVHGDEGFRSQRARIVLLLRDAVWSPDLDPLVEDSMTVRLRRCLRLGRRTRTPIEELRQAAERYRVPLCSLSDAVATGVLGELGVPARQVEGARSALRPR